MKKILLFAFITIAISSCISSRKTKYLQNDKEELEEVITRKESAYRIQAHDVLQVTVSSTNPQVSDFFNLKQDGLTSSLKNHIVNDSGYIFLPVLDSVFVKDLTLGEAQSLVRSRIRSHVTDATVIMKLASFHVTVLGEVGNPGIYSLDGDQVTIFQALGLAGDISEFGNKKMVKLVRKENEATRIILLDVSKSEIVNSEYFFLQPNDVLYVEPIKAKNFKQNVSQLSLIVGFTSLFLLLYNILKK